MSGPLAVRVLSRWLQWLGSLHRALGLGASVLLLAWFTSGMVMLFVSYPAHAPPQPSALELRAVANVQLPAAAMAPFAELTLRSIDGRAAWQFLDANERRQTRFVDGLPPPSLAGERLDGSRSMDAQWLAGRRFSARQARSGRRRDRISFAGLGRTRPHVDAQRARLADCRSHHSLDLSDHLAPPQRTLAQPGLGIGDGRDAVVLVRPGIRAVATAPRQGALAIVALSQAGAAAPSSARSRLSESWRLRGL